MEGWLQSFRTLCCGGVRRFSQQRGFTVDHLYIQPVHVTVPKLETQGKRLIVVGDVHGCYNELVALLDKVNYQRGADRLCFVGDLVGKGPSPLQVVQFAQTERAYCVRGNHDQRVLEYYFGVSTYKDPVDPNKPKRVSEHEHLAKHVFGEAEIEWLRNTPLSLRFEEYNLLVVHAGVNPSIPLEDNQPSMLMNMRGIKDDGSPTSRGGEGTPWAKLYDGNLDIVFGHDAVLGLQTLPKATGLDTGCVYGKQLTALVYPGKQMVHVDAEKMHSKPGG